MIYKAAIIVALLCASCGLNTEPETFIAAIENVEYDLKGFDPNFISIESLASNPTMTLRLSNGMVCIMPPRQTIRLRVPMKFTMMNSKIVKMEEAR